MRKFFVLLFACLFITACASSHMIPLATGEKAVVASPKDAVVIFMRPSSFGGAIQSSVFDTTTPTSKFIGIVSSKTKISYTTTPGKKLFMVVGESADFLEARLEAGKTYFVLVRPRLGIWKTRFSLTPITKAMLGTEEFRKWDTKCKFVKPLPSAHQWANANYSNIQGKRTSYYAKWQRKPKGDKQRLWKQDGKPTDFSN